MLKRIAISGLAGFIVATFLFSMMQTLIAMGDVDLDKTKGPKVIDFVRLKRSSQTEMKKRELPQKAKPKPNPKQPKMNMDSGDGGDGAAVDIGAPQIASDVSLRGGLGLGAAPSDRELTPVVRVAPIYPPRAQEKGVEGWVVVQFTVTESGSVRDASVVDSEPKRIFNRAAIRAIKKWKYKPKIVNGKAVSQPNQKTKIDFTLEKDG